MPASWSSSSRNDGAHIRVTGLNYSGAMVATADARLELRQPTPDSLEVRLGGPWLLTSDPPDLVDAVARRVADAPVRRIVVDAARLDAWDSMLIAELRRLRTLCGDHKVEVDLSALPEGAQRLVDLSTATPERPPPRRSRSRHGFRTAVGVEALRAVRSVGEMIGFLGETMQALNAALRGRARFRWVDLSQVMQEHGPAALPIVGLVNILVGMIVAFIGAIQLERFAAEIYVANLVGIGVVREMGPMMTAIILAGRTSAAFAAQLGTMQVNEEISAFRTLGIPPMQFLVLPRVLALVAMVPLLTIYADVIGIFGGAVVALVKLHLSLTLFYEQLIGAVSVTDWVGGLIKSAVFGVIIVLSGCLRGMQAARSASAVGYAATSAVVTGIVFIIATDAIFTIIYIILGI
jgi:phospholipid/cholesterol/gamma-HCH transport system permease protein